MNDKDKTNNKKKYCQSFNSVIETYSLDEKNHKLVVTGSKDVQKEIDAHADCSLDVMLDKYLGDNIPSYSVVDGVNDAIELDLVDLAIMSSQKDELVKKYNLSPDTSLSDLQLAIKEKITPKNKIIDDPQGGNNDA